MLDDNKVSEISLDKFFDGNPVPTFVINQAHIITHWNRACEQCLGLSAEAMIGSKRAWAAFYSHARPVLADLIVDQALDAKIDSYYHGKYRPSAFIPGAFHAEGHFENMGLSGKWLEFTAAPLYDDDGQLVGAIETIVDVSERREAENELRKAHASLEIIVAKRTRQLEQVNAQLLEDIDRRRVADEELRRQNKELLELNDKLGKTQEQLLQSDKLASIGQLAAGVAHEINNPIGYIFSNFTTLQDYLDGLFKMVQAYQDAEPLISDQEKLQVIKKLRQEIDLDFLKDDIPVLMNESKEGIARVRQIVQDLKDFSRIDPKQEWQYANLHQAIDSTLNIVNNEVKYKADIVKEYGDVPEIECLISQINQVVLNIVVNAAHAIGENRGEIKIKTGILGDLVQIAISDNGSGIPNEILPRIFDPFFTTKPIGKGTGLGLSLSYGIIKKHNGTIEVTSESGRGTTFLISLPIQQNSPFIEV